jgi:RNA polymerase sigma-B factor
VPEIAAALGEDEETVNQALAAHQCYALRSLDAPVDGSEQNLLSSLVGEADVGFRRAEEHVMLIAAVRGLADRDREILRLRFFEGLPQREIAAQIGVTQMQVSRLLAQMFDRLRAAIEPPPAHAPEPLPAA